VNDPFWAVEGAFDFPGKELQRDEVRTAQLWRAERMTLRLDESGLFTRKVSRTS
jgi:hypothetical protein